jgi:phosphomannomutase
MTKSIFKEYDIRGRYPKEIDKSTAYELGRAFVVMTNAKKVAIGRDRRPESKLLMPEFIRGVNDEGCDVYQMGIASTPAVSFAVGHFKLDGGVIITASHNPKGWAGFKMMAENGVPIGMKTGLKTIINLMSRGVNSVKKKSGTVRSLSYLHSYYQFVRGFIDLDMIKGFKVALDVSGGSGDGLVDYVFNRLSLKDYKINFRSGDQYPDHGPNPLLLKNQQVIKNVIIKRRADLGVIWDGDADRAVFIDEQGTFVHPYYINCLLGKVLSEKKSDLAMVVDARMPVGISEVIKKYGGKPIVSRSGTANIIDLMNRNKYLFGCENSGHYFFNFKLADGRNNNHIFSGTIIPVLLILEYLKINDLKMSEAVSEFSNSYHISGEKNFKIDNFEKLKKKILNKYNGFKTKQIDGLSVYGDGWFFNVRSSHTEPLIRLNVEAISRNNMLKIKKDLLTLIK